MSSSCFPFSYRNFDIEEINVQAYTTVYKIRRRCLPRPGSDEKRTSHLPSSFLSTTKRRRSLSGARSRQIHFEKCITCPRPPTSCRIHQQKTQTVLFACNRSDVTDDGVCLRFMFVSCVWIHNVLYKYYPHVVALKRYAESEAK
jgi:hypothetical protein